MRKFNVIEWVAFILVIVGAIFWGIYGLFGVDVVMEVFGDFTVVARIIYDLVGVAGIYVLYLVVRWHTYVG
jgi:uncharacterized membrane protein YuzA (DUF378 family)